LEAKYKNMKGSSRLTHHQSRAHGHSYVVVGKLLLGVNNPLSAVCINTDMKEGANQTKITRNACGSWSCTA